MGDAEEDTEADIEAEGGGEGEEETDAVDRCWLADALDRTLLLDWPRLRFQGDC